MISEIKNRLTVFEYARSYLGLNVSEPGRRCKSFRPGADNPSSLLINERDWYDFGSGSGGDVIDLCAQARHGGSIPEAIHDLCKTLGIQNRVTLNWDKLNNQAAYYHSKLRPEDRDYLHNRNITDKTIDDIMIGYAAKDGQWKNRLMIPYWKCGRIVYFVGRGENPKYMKMKTEDGHHVIWGLNSIQRQGPVIIAEGIFDALSAYQEGFAVLTPVTGRFSKDQYRDLLSMIRDRDVIICFDYDPETQAGQKFTHDLAESLLYAGINPRVVRLQGGTKKADLSEFYTSGGNLHSLFSNSELYFTVKIREEKPNIEKLMNTLRFSYTFSKMCEMMDDAQLDMKDLRKQLQKPPSESLILEKLKERELLYHEQLGWHEYDSGLWKLIPDTQIKAYISRWLGGFKTGSRIGSIFQAARAEFLYTGDFGNELLNMRNGMVKNRSIIPHAPTYHSNIQLNYDFKPPEQTKYPCAWMQFLQDVTGCDETRISLIREMFGYCLSPDCRFQTCFFLLGAGANGKSILLDVLTHLVGPENVSNVEMSALQEPFQRILLARSMVNITSETKSDVKGCETIFKQVVAGEQISGCYKGKDFYSFQPRCKMISASNEYIESKDLSYGFLRRIRFIEFPTRFVEHPVALNEKKKDRKILDKLLLELPAILNWSLDGLEMLYDQDGFTETRDQARMMDAFVKLSSPLHDFIEDMQLPFAPDGWYTRKEVYRTYHDWCHANGTYPFSSRKFWVKLKDLVPLEEKKSHGERYMKIGARGTCGGTL
jgi:P4 family phage/plasmid primase-like protien